MSTLVRQGVDLAGAAPGQWIISGVWPSGSNCGIAGLPQMSRGVVAGRPGRPDVAEVVAVVGAHDHGGVSHRSCASSSSRSEPKWWSIIDSLAP
jgi:hypothetical protein